MNVRELLYRCVHDALSELGEPTMQSLLWHMVNADVKMAPENFDIRKFYSALSDMTGGGADVIMEIVARCMSAELHLEVDHKKSAFENVLRLLELAQKVSR